MKWGFKVFALGDSACGVLCDLEVYSGQAVAGEEGLTHAVGTRKTENLHNQGHFGTTDNFYNSHSDYKSLGRRHLRCGRNPNQPASICTGAHGQQLHQMLRMSTPHFPQEITLT